MSYFSMWGAYTWFGGQGSRSPRGGAGCSGNGTIPVAPRWTLKVTQLSTGPVERWQLLEERERERDGQTYIKQPFDLRAGQRQSECPRRSLRGTGSWGTLAWPPFVTRPQSILLLAFQVPEKFPCHLCPYSSTQGERETACFWISPSPGSHGRGTEPLRKASEEPVCLLSTRT